MNQPLTSSRRTRSRVGAWGLIPFTLFLLGCEPRKTSLPHSDSGPETASSPNTLSPQEVRQGWILLWDGETTFGWEALGEAEWQTGNGVLSAASGNSGWLATNGQFADYLLKLEYRTAADGNSALVLAAMSDHAPLGEFLLERGADPDASGAGYTALHAAVLRSHPGLVRALLARGANPNVQLVKGTPVPRWTYQFIFTIREKGATPFMLAAKYLEPEILRMLAAAGADPLLSMEDGTTALMAAVGLSLNRSTNRRSRLIAPELVAAEWANEGLVLDTVKAAVDAGAAVAAVINETGRGGNTALHGAARNRFRTVVEFLVAQGGDLDIENEDDTTPRELLDRLDAS